CSDLAGAESFGEVRQHLLLPCGETRWGWGRGAAHHGGAEARTHEGSRCHCGVACGTDHVGRLGVLAHEGRGTGLHGCEDLVVAGVHGQDDDAGAVTTGPHGAHDVEAVPVGQLQVGDDDV